MYGEIGQNLTQENLVDVMLQDKSKWIIIATFISRVMRYKCKDERRRQADLHLDQVNLYAETAKIRRIEPS